MIARRTPPLASSDAPHSPDLFRLVESVTDYAIYLVHPDGRVASWNAGAERITGYSADGIIGQSFEVLFSPEDRAAGKPHRDMESALDLGAVQEEGLRARKDGSLFWALYSVTALRNAGQHPSSRNRSRRWDWRAW